MTHTCASLSRGASLRESAEYYARNGIAVLPVKHRGKTPLTRHGVKDATVNRDEVQSWWRRWPSANIGLAVPPGIVVLDLDDDDALDSLRAEDRIVPATVQARTARGYHFWFRVSNPVRNHVGLLEGVDIRALGGYVIAPPSIHPSGVTYRWKVPLASSAIAVAPRWLEELLASPRSLPSPQGRQHSADWLETITQPVPKGRRNQSLAEVAGLLFRYLPNAEIAAQLAYSWARDRMVPPLPEAEVKRTLDSIAGRELRRRRERT